MEAPPPGLLSARSVLWAERLGALDAAWLSARRLLSREEVRYDENRATPAGRALGSLGGLLPAGLTLAAAGPDGHPLNDAREELLERAVAELDGLPDRSPRARAAFKAYFAGKLLQRATFLVMASHAARALPGARHRFYLSRHPAAGLLAAASGLELLQSPSPYESLRLLATPLALLARGLWSGLTAPAVRNNLTGKRGVWAEYYPDDVGGYISRVFWKDRVDREKHDVVFYLDRIDVDCDPATVARIEAFGMRWIDARRPWRLAGLDADAAGRVLKRFTAPGPWWARAFDAHFEATASVWEAAFRRWNVRLLSQHQELSWLAVAQAEAMDRASGALFAFHWSDFPFTREPTHPSPDHVFFVWGVTNKRWLEGKGHGCRHILPSGLWLPGGEAAAGLKKDLGPAEFTLAVFDSSYGYDIFYSAEMLAAFLDRVLGVLEQRPNWKGLFKPKSAASYLALPGGPALMKRLEALVAAGRVRLLERFVSPVDAALACDLAVCFGFNSAGVAAGARGARAVHWNAAGWTRHPLRSDPSQKILYEDLGALEAAIAAAPGDKTIGDFSKWRRLADHFGDLGAAERVGRWVSDALETSADLASAAYRKRHAIGAAFDGPGEWWKS